MQVKQGVLAIAQLGILFAISELGYAVAVWLNIPLPGNMLGMLFLFMLLASGLVRLQWIETAATLLLRHLAFFFVPIAVGLMSLGDLLRASGMALLVTLLASAAVGIVLAGAVTQMLALRGGSASTLSVGRAERRSS